VHREYASAGVAVIDLHTISEHHAAMAPVALEASLHEYRVAHPVGVDRAMAGDPIPVTMRRYGMQGTPALVLIDRAGRLRLHQFGRIDDLSPGVMIGRLMPEDMAAATDAPVRDESGAPHGACDEHMCPAGNEAADHPAT